MSICGGYFKPQPTNYSILPHNLKILMIQIFLTPPLPPNTLNNPAFIMHCTHVGCVHDDAGRHCTDYRPTQLKSYHDSADFAILLLLIVVIQKRSWGLLVGAPPLHSTQRSLIKRRSTEKARLVGVEHILKFCHHLSNCHFSQFVLPTSQSMEAFQPVMIVIIWKALFTSF